MEPPMSTSAATAESGGLTAAELLQGRRRVGVEEGMALIVHSSLSSLGWVDGGAATVVASLRAAVGPGGTIVTPAYTAQQVRDPDKTHVGVPTAEVIARRAAVPTFRADMPTTVGAIPESLRTLPESLRSSHPYASLAAVGAQAATIVERQTLGFAVGRTSPFGRLHDLGGHILLLGVGHNRNSFLHYVETLTPRPRLRLGRFPYEIDGERVWVETLDVANDNSTHFPTVGREFEQRAGIPEVLVGDAPCRLLPIRPFVSFAVRRLTELLDADAARHQA
jgi:aminoglycoside 3-N-acetyltransferase